MGHEVWIRRDGLRELHHESTHCMGDPALRGITQATHGYW